MAEIQISSNSLHGIWGLGRGGVVPTPQMYSRGDTKERMWQEATKWNLHNTYTQCWRLPPCIPTCLHWAFCLAGWGLGRGVVFLAAEPRVGWTQAGRKYVHPSFLGHPEHESLSSFLSFLRGCLIEPSFSEPPPLRHQDCGYRRRCYYCCNAASNISQRPVFWKPILRTTRFN